MNNSRSNHNFESRDMTNQVVINIKRSMQFSLGLMTSVAIMLFNKDNIIELFSTNVLLTLLVSTNLLFVLILAWEWFLFDNQELDLLRNYIKIKDKPKTFSVSLVYSYPVIIGFVYAFYLASVANIVLFIAFSIIIQLISFVGDCITMNALVHEGDSCDNIITSDYKGDNEYNDKMYTLIKNEIIKYYLDGRYVVRIPFYFFLQLYSLHIVTNFDKQINQKVIIAYGLTLLANFLNETYLAVLRYRRNHRIAKIREDFAKKVN